MGEKKLKPQIGISLDKQIASGQVSVRDGWNQTYDVNVAGTYVVTHTFMPLLLRSSDPRLLFVTSGISIMEVYSKGYYPGPAPSSSWPADGAFNPVSYRSSKVALNMMMLTWHWQLQKDGVKVWSVSPGFLATGLGGNKESMIQAGAGHPSIGGKLIASVVEGERDADVGKVVNGPGVQPF